LSIIHSLCNDSWQIGRRSGSASQTTSQPFIKFMKNKNQFLFIYFIQPTIARHWTYHRTQAKLRPYLLYFIYFLPTPLSCACELCISHFAFLLGCNL